MDETKIVLILKLKLHNFMTNFIDQFSGCGNIACA